MSAMYLQQGLLDKHREAQKMLKAVRPMLQKLESVLGLGPPCQAASTDAPALGAQIDIERTHAGMQPGNTRSIA
jgi:hypothetical protein